jgi:hypothetical protein
VLQLRWQLRLRCNTAPAAAAAVTASGTQSEQKRDNQHWQQLMMMIATV